MFKLYAVYCSAQSDANQRIEQLKLKHPEFSKFVEVTILVKTKSC